MGEEAFEAAVREAGVSIPVGDSDGQSSTLEELLQMIAGNTVAVLTAAPEHKEEWWQQLGQLQEQAQAQGDEAFGQLLGLLRRLVEGADTARLGPEVPAAYKEVWETVLRGLRGRTG